MSEWFETKIGEQVLLQRGFDITKAQQRAGGIPVVSSGGVSSFHDTPAASGPGVVLGRKGTLGTVFYIAGDYWPHDTTLWVKEFRGNHPRFVYYFFKSIAEDLLLLDVGTSNPALNRNHVHPMTTLWPTRSLQERIAELLGVLDDKIALNRRMNRALEATAATLFRSWFVDFDPVVAKAEGRRAVGVPEAAYGSFPNRFIESENGLIPEGWMLGSIQDLATFVNGRNFTTGATDRGRVVIRIVELKGGPGGSTVYNDVPAADANVARPGDLLFSWSGSLYVDRWHRDVALINQHIFKVVCDRCPQWFVHQQLDLALPFFQEIAAGKATTMGHIKREHLAQVPVVLPPAETIQAAEPVFAPLYTRVHINEREILSLATLRDMLLPHLLSGAIRLRDAERLVEANV